MKASSTDVEKAFFFFAKEKRKKDDDDIDKRLRNLKTDLQYISKGQRSKREVGEIRERDSFVCSGQSYNSYNAAQKFSTFHVDSLFVKKDFVQLLKTTTKNEKGPGQDSNFITMLNWKLHTMHKRNKKYVLFTLFPQSKGKKSCWNGTRWQNKLCWKSSHFVGSHPRRSENENTIVCFCCHTILMLIQSKNKTKKKRWRKRGWHINHSCHRKAKI